MEFKGTATYTIVMVFLGIAIILNAIADSQTQDELNKLKSYVNTLVEKYFGKYELISKINVKDVKYIACHCPENEVYCECVLLIPKNELYPLHRISNKTFR